MLGKQSVMFKIMRNEMFIIFYILRLTATLRIVQGEAQETRLTGEKHGTHVDNGPQAQ